MTTNQTSLSTFATTGNDDGFDMDEYERELDAIVAQVIPDKTAPA